MFTEHPAFIVLSGNEFGFYEEQFKRQARVVLRKKLFGILFSSGTLYELSILLLSLTNYSSFDLSIYLFIYLPTYLFN